MSGLYIKLDVEYMTNPKLLDAGPLAELIYIRALCFAKRTKNDGILSESQTKLVTFGVSSPKKHVKILVDSGLWDVRSDGGYQIAGWLERNKSSEQIERESELKRQASVLANHERWHTGPDSRSSATCELCHPKADPKADPNVRSTEPKAETETETETKEETKTEPGADRRQTGSTSSATNPTTTQRINTVYEILTDQLVAKHGPKTPIAPDQYRGTVTNNLIKQHGERIKAYVTDRDDLTADAAAAVLALELTK